MASLPAKIQIEIIWCCNSLYPFQLQSVNPPERGGDLGQLNRNSLLGEVPNKTEP